MLALRSFKLERCLNIDSAIQLELHGFADSSEKGYCGVVYLRAVHADSKVTVSLLLAKTKVAPIKKVSLPRLELCAVVLVFKLLHFVLQQLELQDKLTASTAWTDSMIALNWLRSSPHRWKTYVANRVSQAQSWLAPEQFRHVPSPFNPADCATRGLYPLELLNHPMWMSGPAWLATPVRNWPATNIRFDGESNEERRVITFHATIPPQDDSWHIVDVCLERSSSLSFLKRLMAWGLTFLHNARHRKDIRTGWLPAHELSIAMVTCVKRIQQQEFAEDIRRLTTGRQATIRHRKLNPFLDEHGVLRVGGRLCHAALTRGRKHPILLPKSHPFTHLVIEHYHRQHLHPGPQNLHAIIQGQFWIISGREVIRHRLSKCVTCFRTRPSPIQPFMGDLPATRFQAIKAFAVTGVDYGGPYEITLGKMRKARIYKAYICLFVCFATKAVHIELASELTTEAFLAALRRFIARRGSINEIHSDCGTNFVGAKRKLADWAQLIASDDHNRIIAGHLADRGIAWHLNPLVAHTSVVFGKLASSRQKC